jgi:hypothetical protein
MFHSPFVACSSPLLRLLTPALSSVEEERERGQVAG